MSDIIYGLYVRHNLWLIGVMSDITYG